MPCIQRLAWPEPPTSYSAVTDTSPSAITLAFAVVPPMSNEIRLGRCQLPAGQRRGNHAGRGTGFHRHRRHAQPFRDVEHAAGRAHHMQLRQTEPRDRALQSVEIATASTGPTRHTPRSCWRVRTRGSPAAPPTKDTRRQPGNAARSASPTRRSCASFRNENRNDTATVCSPASRIASISAGSSSSASGVTTSPCASIRSVISNRQRRGTSTAGASCSRS